MLTKDEFRDFAAKVAAELGMTLDTDHDVFGAAINGSDGSGYYLCEPYGSHGKIECSGRYPVSSYYFRPGDRPTIGVTITRGPAVVAAEIKRRLAPTYAATLAKVLDYNATQTASTRRRVRLARRITRLFPKRTDRWGKTVDMASLPSHWQSEGRTQVLVQGPELGGGQVNISANATEVEFERFRVPAAVAVKMLAVYADAC
jgi:hypothetical protein